MTNKIKKTTYLVICILSGFGLILLKISPAQALSMVLRIPEKYADINAGDRIYFELDVKYPENTERKDLRIEYEITKDNEIVAQSKVLKAIETQSAFTDFIPIPESADGGLYILKAKVKDYKNLNEETSASFRVTEKGNELRLYFIILLTVILLFGGVVVWEVNRIRISTLQRNSV